MIALAALDVTVAVAAVAAVDVAAVVRVAVDKQWQQNSN